MATSTSTMPSAGFPPSTPSQTPQDTILSHYQTLLAAPNPLPPALAAISALITSLEQTSTLTTTSETLALTSSLSTHLAASVPHATSLSAGTQLFQRYLLNSLHASATAFPAAKTHSLSTASLLLERAQQLPQSIASAYADTVIAPHATVLTYGYSALVEAVLLSAARQRIPYRLVAVLPPSTTPDAVYPNAALSVTATRHSVDLLRDLRVPVAIVPSTAAASVLAETALPLEGSAARQAAPSFTSSVTTVLLAADAVLATGGILAPRGTRQIAALARAQGLSGGLGRDGLRVFAVAESFRFVRWLPVGSGGEAEQEGIRFGVEKEKADGEEAQHGDAVDAHATDITPPEFLTGILTESGVVPPAAVAEELIRMWF